MAKQVTCKYCKAKIDKSTAYNPSPRVYFCTEDCHKKYKEKNETKIDTEAEDYKRLIAYVCELYGVRSPNMVWLAQIKRFHNDNSMKYSGMLLALKYYYEGLGNAVDYKYGLGILEWVYDDAKKDYMDKKRVLKAIEEFDEEETVKIVKPNIKTINKLKHEYDISEL